MHFEIWRKAFLIIPFVSKFYARCIIFRLIMHRSFLSCYYPFDLIDMAQESSSQAQAQALPTSTGYLVPLDAIEPSMIDFSFIFQ